MSRRSAAVVVDDVVVVDVDVDVDVAVVAVITVVELTHSPALKNSKFMLERTRTG